MSDDVWRWSAVETATAIRTGKITCLQAVEAAIDRMREANGSINGVTVDLTETALEQARNADRRLAAGDEIGPLYGVPMTIKENVDQEGMATANGVPAFESLIAPDDSPVVTNLLDAGAIAIGRTNTPEFSLRWFTDNPLRGRTLNPWNDTVTPGGSSGGAAASVALGIGSIALGSDLGGSLRYPAYACGVATIRPSLGRIPAYNPSGADERPPSIQLMSVQGPIAREVGDVRLGLNVMARQDHRDPWSSPAPETGPALKAPLAVAVTKSPAGVPCDPAVAAALDAAAGHLSDAGYAVSEVDPPVVAEIAECWRTLLITDVRAMMEPAIRKFGSPDINAVYDGYASTVEPQGVEDYVRALAGRTGLLRQWARFMEDYPLVLAPVSQVPPFLQDEDLKGESRVRQMLGEQSMLYAVNLLGLPAAAVPTGLHEGVPMGVQIIGQPFREDLCLDAAEAVESATGILSRQLWD